MLLVLPLTLKLSVAENMKGSCEMCKLENMCLCLGMPIVTDIHFDTAGAALDQ